LSEFDSIILLAGHSSVPACDRFPTQSFFNNVSGFVDLIHKLRGQKLIFASSISIYVSSADYLAKECDPFPEAVSYYDLHKQMIERYATLAYPNSYALRFGTVCGPSPNLRKELLLNSMIWSALHKFQIEVANRPVHRPLLGIGDLCRAIETIISGSVPAGCYNLASCNVRIGDVADYIVQRFEVPCVEIERETKYDIQVSTRKFSEASGMEFQDDLASLVEALEEVFVSCTEVGSTADEL
jgi:nucleoside-diphosphate-sugar epimerase